MSAGIRERVAKALRPELWTQGADEIAAYGFTHSGNIAEQREVCLRQADAVLAEVCEWLGSDEAREVVVLSGERPRRATAILDALIDKTKEVEE